MRSTRQGAASIRAERGDVAEHVIAIDQGTTSTRAIVFDARGSVVTSAQREHEQIFPKAGWVEHDPEEIWTNTSWVLEAVLEQSGLSAGDIAGIGVTNQRETAVVWDRRTGRPIANAIVWQDTRTQPRVDRLAADGGVDRFAGTTGLPLATYFSASKIAWILDNVEGARGAAEGGDLLFGTPDSWVIWKLTDGREHITDVTNASRTLLMDLETLDWSDEMLRMWDIPRSMLPGIRPSSAVVGEVVEPAPAAGGEDGSTPAATCDEHMVTVLSAQVTTACCPTYDPNCGIPTYCSSQCAPVFNNLCVSPLPPPPPTTTRRQRRLRQRGEQLQSGLFEGTINFSRIRPLAKRVHNLFHCVSWVN